MKIAFLIILAAISVTTISVTTISAQEIPEEFYPISKLYDINANNEELIISIDRSSYKPGDSLHLVGNVYDISGGRQIFIEVIDPSGNIRSEIIIISASDGFFEVQNDIPKDIPEGDYTISAKYLTNGTPVSLAFIVFVETIETFVKACPGTPPGP